MPVDLPNLPYDEVALSRVGFGVDQDGALGGPSRRFERAGSRHQAQFTLPGLISSSASLMLGARLKARATGDTVRAKFPQPAGLVDPALVGVLVNGGGQTGRSLNVKSVPSGSSRTNLALYSEQFDNAAWGGFNVTVTPNVLSEVDGTTGDKVVVTTTNSSHGFQQTISVGSGVTYCSSVYGKTAGMQWIMAFDVNGSILAFFDLINGVTANVAAGVTAVITAQGGGVYRCSVSRTTTGSISDFRWYITNAGNSGGVSYAGDNVSGVYLWGAQFELAAGPTAYIGPTLGSPVTSAVILAKAGSALSFTVSGQTYLYLLTDDLVAGSTTATLNLDCLLRASPADGAAIEFQAPVIEGFVQGADVGWNLDKVAAYGFDFTVRERA